MNMNKVRRIVSGKKARFVTEDGLELDLCYVTDRIIICGLPASGIEALYRNDRQSVRHFLTTRYGEHYRIFNFCPRFENAYDAAYFNNQVSRFPFPDHHPPPLSLIPLATRRMHDWLTADERNVVVIHCKAGKGRSGTMCCCYLLSLPSLPQPPQIAQNISTKAKKAMRVEESSATASIAPSAINSPDASDSEDDVAHPPRTQSGGAAMDIQGLRGGRRRDAGQYRMKKLVDNLDTSADEGNSQSTGSDDNEEPEPNAAANKEVAGMADKLRDVFQLHTTQRMRPDSLVQPKSPSEGAREAQGSVAKPKKPVRGVSIPSQRRFVGYWSKVLSKQDPRPLDLLSPPNPARVERERRQANIVEVRIFMPPKMPGFPVLISRKALSVHLSRYRTSFVDKLEEQDLGLREMRRLEKRLKAKGKLEQSEETKLGDLKKKWLEWDDDKWDDKRKMFDEEGVLVQMNDDNDTENDRAEETFRRLVPQTAGSGGKVVVDADREVQFKVLIGESGRKHSILPDVGSLGYAWIIPSFHLKDAPNLDIASTLRYTVSLDNTEIDFFKSQSGITKIEIDLEWTVY